MPKIISDLSIPAHFGTEMPAEMAVALEHLERLVSKRDRLNEAVVDAVWQLLSIAERTPRDVGLAREFHIAIRDARVSFNNELPNAQQITDAVGYSATRVNSIHYWQRRKDESSDDFYTGTFPIDRQVTPLNNTPCVYALFDWQGDLAYIGQSKIVRTRLKTHWRERGGLWRLDRWAVAAIHPGQDRLDVEAELIRRFKPRGNKAGVE